MDKKNEMATQARETTAEEMFFAETQEPTAQDIPVDVSAIIERLHTQDQNTAEEEFFEGLQESQAPPEDIPVDVPAVIEKLYAQDRRSDAELSDDFTD